MFNFKDLFSKRPKRPLPWGYRVTKRNVWRDRLYAVFGRIRKIFTRFLLILGAIVFVMMVLGVYSFYNVVQDRALPLPDKMVLTYALQYGMSETPQPPTLRDPFGYLKPTVRDLVNAIEAAAKDDRVMGLVVRYEGAPIGVVHAAELRQAIKHFKDAGKFSYIYGESFDNGSGALGVYYLASAFDEIWMQPVGQLGITGIGVEMPFVRGLMDLIGVEPQIFQRKEYKSGAETMMRSEPSSANRAATADMIQSLSDSVLPAIAESRGMTAEQLKSLIDRAPLLDQDAAEEGLVDRLAYVDEIFDMLKENYGDDFGYVHLNQYRAHIKPELKSLSTKPDHVALIYIDGMIVSNIVRPDSGMVDATKIGDIITALADEEDLPAIVVRVNSPGGSPNASETIRRSLEYAKQKGKKIIVSMGPYAASGGYWLVTPADIIFAEPTTLTGSIGVYGGKVSLKELWGKIGVNWYQDGIGKNADMWSLNKPYSKSGEERINAMLDNIYGEFVGRVAEGRKMDPEAVGKIARGHVWTGAQAVKNGLVDRLGSLNDTLDETAKMMGLENRDQIQVDIYPREKPSIEQVLDMLGDGLRVQQSGPEILLSTLPEHDAMRLRYFLNAPGMVHAVMPY